jgi:hypothetical protein
MRKLSAVLILAVISVSSLSFAGNIIEFRLVLVPDESGSMEFDIVKDGADSVYAQKLPYLADRDIDSVEIFRSASAARQLLVGFKFNETGRKRIYNLTKRFAGRRIAIFADGRYMMSSSVISPVFFKEMAVIRWPGTEAELRKFAAELNKKPPGIIALYIEEQGKYNDVAADAWAEAYLSVNKFIEEKRGQAVEARGIVEEAGGGE